MLLAALGSLVALGFAAVMFARVKKQPAGTPEMEKISKAVSNGASAYLKRQYMGVGVFFAVVFVVLMAMAFAGLLSFFTPVAFLTGGFFRGFRASSACARPPWPTAARPTPPRTA